ncbi:MAG: PEP-CTERM sorting domain-containing protein [Steroidobacteraceae bacterium]
MTRTSRKSLFLALPVLLMAPLFASAAPIFKELPDQAVAGGYGLATLKIALPEQASVVAYDRSVLGWRGYGNFDLGSAVELGELGRPLFASQWLNLLLQRLSSVNVPGTPVQQVDEPANVPEPATLALLGGGLLAFGFASARRRRSA